MWRSGRVEECNHEGCRFTLACASLLLICRKVGGKWSESRRKMVGKLTENCQKISPSANVLKIFYLRRINLISMLKKCSVTLMLEYCVIRSGWRSFPSTLFTVLPPGLGLTPPSSPWVNSNPDNINGFKNYL